MLLLRKPGGDKTQLRRSRFCPPSPLSSAPSRYFTTKTPVGYTPFESAEDISADGKFLTRSSMAVPQQQVPATRIGFHCSSNESVYLGSLVSLAESYGPQFVNLSRLTPEAPKASRQSLIEAGRVLAKLKEGIVGIDPVLRPCCGIAIQSIHNQHDTNALVSIHAWSDSQVLAKEATIDKQYIEYLTNLVNSTLGELGIVTSKPPIATDFSTRVSLADAADAFLTQQKHLLMNVSPWGTVEFALDPQASKLVLPGSFNPLHLGHSELLTAAYCHLQSQGRTPSHFGFELSAFNVDKAALANAQLLDRLAQFAGGWHVTATNAPTFIQKARLLKNTTFVVGYDTAVRIIMKKYYNNSEQQMIDSFREFEELGCSFLVAGRVVSPPTPGAEAQFATLADILFPDNFTHKHLFQPVPTDLFRNDISSTDIRRQARK